MIQVKVFREGHINELHRKANKWIEENGVDIKKLAVDAHPSQGNNLIVYYESKKMLYDNSPDSTDFRDMLRYLGHYQEL